MLKRSLEDLGAYFTSVAHYWWVIVIGISGGFLGWILNALPSVQIDRWIWWSAMIAGLIVAQFMAFRGMKHDRDELRRSDVGQETLTQISNFRDEFVTLLNEPKEEGDNEIRVIRHKYEELRKRVRDYLSDNLSPSEAGIFYQIGTFSYLGKPTQENFQETKARSMMARDIEHLKVLIEDYGRGRKTSS